jgi:hypothetical protein
MSWSKQHTTVRRCGDHNEHPLQHHNAHCTAEEEGTHKSFPRNKTTQKQKQMAHIRRSSKHRRSSPAWARQLHHIPVAAGWTRTGAGFHLGQAGWLTTHAPGATCLIHFISTASCGSAQGASPGVVYTGLPFGEQVFTHCNLSCSSQSSRSRGAHVFPDRELRSYFSSSVCSGHPMGRSTTNGMIARTAELHSLSVTALGGS